MLTRSLRLSYVIVGLFGCILALFFMNTLEEYSPVGPTWHMAILHGKGTPSASVSEVNQAIHDWGSSRNIDVVRLVANPDNPKEEADLYVLSDSGGSFARDWVKSGYPSFNSSRQYTVHSFSDSQEIDPSGEYVVGGSSEDVAALQQVVAHFGYTPNGFERIASIQVALGLLGGVSMWAAPASVILLVIALTMVGVSMNARGYAIERLQEFRMMGAFRRDMAAAAPFVTAVVAGMGIISLGILAVVNRLHQFGVYLGLSGIFILSGLVIAVCAHLVALAVAWRVPLLMAIKGGVATRWMVRFAYLVRLLTMIMVFVVAGLALNDAVTASKAQTRYDQWAGATQLGAISIGGGEFSSDGTYDDRAARKAAGTWERSLEARGQLLVAMTNMGTGESGQGELPLGRELRDVMYVNSAYLTLADVTGPGGQPIPVPTDPAAATVVIPGDIADQQAAVLKHVSSRLSFYSDPNGVHPLTPMLTTVTVPTGKDRPTYNARSASPGSPPMPSVLHDPVMVVLPPGNKFFTDSSYYAYSSQGMILAMDTKFAQADLAAHPEARAGILGVTPAVQTMADDLSRAHLSVVASVFNNVIMLAALVATTLALAIVYTRRRGSFIFAARMSGWTFWSMFKGLFTWDTIVVLMSAAGASAALMALISSLVGPATPGNQSLVHTLQSVIPISGAIVVAIIITVLVSAVITNAKRIIQARSADVG